MLGSVLVPLHYFFGVYEGRLQLAIIIYNNPHHLVLAEQHKTYVNCELLIHLVLLAMQLRVSWLLWFKRRQFRFAFVGSLAVMVVYRVIDLSLVLFYLPAGSALTGAEDIKFFASLLAFQLVWAGGWSLVVLKSRRIAMTCIE